MNVVRELAIAANIPMPKVYIIDDTAPNAFATGRDPQHASIAITTGLLEKLDREELQGVIGHELSHVRNFDIRFSLLVGVMVGAIALLADFFLRFTFWGGVGGRSRDRDSGGSGGPGDHLRRRHRPGDPRADHQPVHPARGQPPARVPRRRVVGRADPQPVRPGAGAGQDRGRPGGPRGRQPRHPAHVLHEPDQEVRGALVGPDVDPPADPRPDQPAARADRRAAARRVRRGRRWPGWSRGPAARAAAGVAGLSEARGIVRTRRRAADGWLAIGPR